MTVDILIEDDRWQAVEIERLAEEAAAVTFGYLGLNGVEVSLLACDDKRIASLNGEFRGKPAVTNVLSWPSEERGAEEPGGRPFPPGDPELGDIALAWETCAREAAETGKPHEDHISHLLVHGFLHLLGYDHIDDKDAALMERIEVEILGKMGVADPYGSADA